MKRSVLIAGLVVLSALSTRMMPLDGCGGKPADVVFIVDVSSSIWPKHFREHILTFLHDVIDTLDVGRGVNQTRVGAVTFSDNVQLEFYLHHFLEKDKLLNRVKQIKSRGGNTDTHEALDFVDRYLFLPANGGRTNVSRIVIVITDGESRNSKATIQSARTLKEHGTTVFAIGVGNDIGVQELRDMASEPSSEFVFEVTNFEALKSIQSELVIKTCQVPPSTTPLTRTTLTTTSTTTSTMTTTSTPTSTTTITTSTSTTIPTSTVKFDDDPNNIQGDVACINHPADVYFVLDSSSSIWIHDFETSMLNFVRSIINVFDVGVAKTRVGVITFSDAPRTVFGLAAHVDKDELLKAVNPTNVKYTPGLTYTAEALQMARRNLYNEGRRGVEPIIILITDGQSKDPNATLTVARGARRDGVTMFTVGVGEGVDSGELHAVASVPSEDFTFMVDDFTALPSIKAVLAARTCGVNASLLLPSVAPDVITVTPCSMRNADIIFAHDWNMLGGTVSSHIVSTLQHVSSAFAAMSADVTIGSMTSTLCEGQRLVSLSNNLALSKQVQTIVRTQQSQMASVLKTVRVSGFSAQNGHRLSARKVAVIVLDSSSTSKLSLVASEAAKLREEDVEVFAITAGKHGVHLVNDLVSEPKEDHVVHLPGLDFSSHGFASSTILNSLCGMRRL